MTVHFVAPASKSMTQRALIMGALSGKPVHIGNPLRCQDSEMLARVLTTLGARISWDDHSLTMPGAAVAPLHHSKTVLDCGNAGTALRFAACLSLVIEGGPLVFDGDARMRCRPIHSLCLALEILGVRVKYLGNPGFPPLELCRERAPDLVVDLDTSGSSQFASGLALVAPLTPHGLELCLHGDKVSGPYLEMTLSMMARAGIRIERPESRRIRVYPGPYFPGVEQGHLTIEGDWSSAGFLLAMPLMADLEVEVAGLMSPAASLQGDAVIIWFLEELKKPRSHFFDLTHTPDLIGPLAAAAVFLPHRTIIRGVAHARTKECNRLAVLAGELSRVGFNVREHPDGLDIEPFDPRRIVSDSLVLDPHNDHRMAMTFGLVSLRCPGIKVQNPECVAKSFPEFWHSLEIARQAGSRTVCP